MKRRRSSYKSARRPNRRRSSSRRGSGRSLILVIILFGITLAIAPPIKHFFTQRAQINALRAQVSSDQAELLEAKRELERWKDPNYIKSQARERLHFVLPGERQYIVTRVEGEDSTASTTKVADQLPADQPWYSKLIASITEAGTSPNAG